MADIKKVFGVNRDKEVSGVWEKIAEGIRVKVARMGNPAYQKVLNEALRPHRRSVRRGTLPDGVMEECIVKATAKAVLLDWEGLEEDGKAIEYSAQNAVRLLTDYRDFRDQVIEIASELSLFQDEEAAETEKN